MSERTITHQEMETNYSGFCLRLPESEEPQAANEETGKAVVSSAKADLQRWNEMREQFCEVELPFP